MSIHNRNKRKKNSRRKVDLIKSALQFGLNDFTSYQAPMKTGIQSVSMTSNGFSFLVASSPDDGSIVIENIKDIK